MLLRRSSSRQGTIVVLTALTLIIILTFIALAFDLGLLMLARNQSQVAADAAAMAGARTLTGDTSNNNNYDNVVPNAKVAAKANSILGQVIDADSQLSLTIGDYYYDTGSLGFKINPSGKQEGNNWTLAQATITSSRPAYFARLLGFDNLNTTATATAVHRPRDTAIVVDFSGSMRFESMLGGPHGTGSTRSASMNPDTVVPTFGHYTGNSSLLSYSSDMTVSSGEQIGKANVAVATTAAPGTVISGFYADETPFGTSTPAFTAASADYATTPGGDVPLKASKGSGGYAKHVSDHLAGNSSTTNRDWRWELDGYAAYSGGGTNATTSAAADYAGTTFHGYTQGPNYWGKTFFNWPPDPRNALTTTAPPGCSSGMYTSSQIQNIVGQFLRDFGYSAADFNNTAVTTEAAVISTSATTMRVPASTTANFPTGSLPMKVLVGRVTSGMFTTTPAGNSPEVVSVTSIGSTSGGLTTWNITRAQDSTTAVANVTTTPSASFTTSATSITMTSATNFPTTSLPFKIMVGTTSGGVFTGTPEIMTVNSVSGTGSRTWAVTRGVYGTTKVSGTTSMTVALVSTVGLLTGPALMGTYTAANTTVNSTSTGTPTVVGIGRTPSTSNLWTSWSSTTLGDYLTGSVYQPASAISTPPIQKLTSSDPIYLQMMRLYNRNGGPGMPKNGSGVAVPTDWRARFFKMPSGAPLTDTSRLYSSGTWRVPSNTTYLINYDAILDWIKNSGPNPFPNQLRAGGVVYYTSIPSTINVNTFPPTDPNQRFWKEYIDEVLGVQQTGGSGSSPTYTNEVGYSGFGSDFTWGSASSSASTSWGNTALSSYSSTSPTTVGYSDNPRRGLLRMWFGPLSLVDFLGNYNALADPTTSSSLLRLWWPGTVKETPTYQTKLAIQAAIKDTIKNHPNDLVSLTFFSSPKSSATGSGAVGYYNYTRAPMGRDQRSMINALWFSPKVNTTNSEISVYNSSGVNNGDIYDVPRANGGTCYNMPLMLAYNQFSSNPDLVNFTANALPGTAGGLGRVGANKMLVFETDGMVNTGASATLQSSTNGTGYYRVRVADANNYSANGTEFPTGVSSVSFSTGATQSQAITQQICNNLTAGGFSTTRKPVLVHCIAFGSLFESTNNSSSKTNALSNLAAMEVIGKVQSTGATTLASNKIIVGDFDTRLANMQSAISSIMQDGVSVTLISSGPGKP